MKHLSLPTFTQSALERFWASFTKSDDPRDCWIWEKNCNPDWGYGKFSFRGIYYAAHRVSYKLHYGVDPDELLVCHDCPNGDNPACVNPRHLFLGTDNDNCWDKVKKGRHRCGRGLSNGRYTKPESYVGKDVGEKNPMAKLTEVKVRDIKRRIALGESHSHIALDFDVCSATISQIARGKNWAHVV